MASFNFIAGTIDPAGSFRFLDLGSSSRSCSSSTQIASGLITSIYAPGARTASRLYSRRRQYTHEFTCIYKSEPTTEQGRPRTAIGTRSVQSRRKFPEPAICIQITITRSIHASTGNKSGSSNATQISKLRRRHGRRLDVIPCSRTPLAAQDPIYVGQSGTLAVQARLDPRQYYFDSYVDQISREKNIQARRY